MKCALEFFCNKIKKGLAAKPIPFFRKRMQSGIIGFFFRCTLLFG